LSIRSAIVLPPQWRHAQSEASATPAREAEHQETGSQQAQRGRFGHGSRLQIEGAE
jgi:hypothetical protein